MPKLNLPRRDDLPQLESDVLRECREWLATQPDISIHRNNVGSASMNVDDFIRAGMPPEFAKMAANCVQARFRGMRFGLSIGSSDLIGSIQVQPFVSRDVLGPGIVGTIDPYPYLRVVTVPRFLCVELKQPGKRPSDDQERFLEAKRRIGAVAFWADNLATVQDMIGRARRWEI